MTGRTPHLRVHAYVKLDGKVTPDELESVNVALKTLFGSDDVADHSRLMRLAGTINYPTKDKLERGYVSRAGDTGCPEGRAGLHRSTHLIGLTGTQSLDTFSASDDRQARPHRRRDHGAARGHRVDGQWHNSMRNAIASMIGYGWADIGDQDGLRAVLEVTPTPTW